MSAENGNKREKIDRRSFLKSGMVAIGCGGLACLGYNELVEKVLTIPPIRDFRKSPRDKYISDEHCDGSPENYTFPKLESENPIFCAANQQMFNWAESHSQSFLIEKPNDKQHALITVKHAWRRFQPTCTYVRVPNSEEMFRINMPLNAAPLNLVDEPVQVDTSKEYDEYVLGQIEKNKITPLEPVLKIPRESRFVIPHRNKDLFLPVLATPISSNNLLIINNDHNNLMEKGYSGTPLLLVDKKGVTNKVVGLITMGGFFNDSKSHFSVVNRFTEKWWK